MTHYLVKFNDYWADEMDISSITIVNEKVVELIEKQYLKYQSEEATQYIEFYFGTNEYNTYNFIELYNCLDITPITPEETQVLVKFTTDMSAIAESAIEYLLNNDVWEVE